MTIPAKTVTKDPDAVLDYVWDWANGGANDGAATDTGWLQGDTISSYTTTVASGITLDSGSNSNTAVTLWLSGGTAGNDYDVAVKITTAAARTDERTLRVQVRER